MPGENLTRVEAEARAALLDVRSYDIRLDLTDPGPTFRSVSRISVECRQPGASTFLDLVAPAVRHVELNGRALDPAHVVEDGRVRLEGLAESNVIEVEADAEWSHTGEGLHRFTDPVDGRTYCYSQCEVADARRIFANFEQPDLKARFSLHVTTPADWLVWSNQPALGPGERDDVALATWDWNPEPSAPPAVWELKKMSLRQGSSRSRSQRAASGNVAERGRLVGPLAAPPAPDSSAPRTWDFPPTPRLSTYLVAIVGGPYTAWHDTYRSPDGRTVPLGLLVRPSMAGYLDAAEVFSVTKDGLEFYERSFGLPFPFAKYDQAFVPEFNAGAMENAGLVTHTEEYVFRSRPTQARIDRRALTILHELAHMWFGDLVTMRWWNDLWLNESFAEFVSHLAAASTRWPDAWTMFLASEKGWALTQDQLPSTHPIVADIRDLADVQVNFDGITYAKGAAVLRQLVAWVGQEAFLRGVNAYLTKHAWGNATLADLLAELEVASGRALGDWSRQWLEEPGVTTLRPVVTPSPALVTPARVDATPSPPPVTPTLAEATPSPSAVTPSPPAGTPSPSPVTPAPADPPTLGRLTIAQEVPQIYAENARGLGLAEVRPSLRPHRLAVAGYEFVAAEGSADGGAELVESLAGLPAPGGPETARPQGRLIRSWRVETDVTGAATSVTEAAGRPLPALLLINDGDLAYAKLRLDPASLEVARTHLAGLTDPLARGLVWGSLWDATRDGEWPASHYVEATLNAIAHETDPSMRATLLSQLRTALAFFVTPARRDDLTAATADRLETLTRTAPPGGDAQLQFFKSFTVLARQPAALDALAETLAGRGPAGLAIDTDLRWEVVTALVAGGRLGPAEIAAELERDPTTRGREWAAGARAAQPTLAAKEWAWAGSVTDLGVTNSTQRALIAGFGQVHERALLTDFVAAYFACLEEVWTARSLQTATHVVEGLYPLLSLNEVDVVAATDRWLGQLGDRQPALRRLVIERRAAVVRALRAQAADAAVPV